MLSDLLTGIGWATIITLPVIVACRQPIESQSGYFDRYWKTSAQDATPAQATVPSNRRN